jgi:Phosphotransferase enzyme family
VTALAPPVAASRLARVLRRVDGRRETAALLAALKAESAHPEIAALNELATIRTNARGWLLFGRRPGRSWSVVVKLYAGERAPEQAGRLFAHHRYAFERMGDGGPFGVPEPLALFGAPPGYAMRHVTGRAASSVARRTLIHRDRTRAELLARAAGWLERYHRSGEWQQSRASAAYLVNALEKSVDPPDGKYASIPRETEFRAMLDRLRAGAERLATFPFPKAALHGDFNLHNLVVDGERTWGIDFASGPHNVRPVSFDVANCLFFLTFRDGWPGEDRAGVPGGFDRRAVEIFARHYPGLPWDSASTAWLLLHHQLQFWARLANLNMERKAGLIVAMCRHGAETLAARL